MQRELCELRAPLRERPTLLGLLLHCAQPREYPPALVEARVWWVVDPRQCHDLCIRQVAGDAEIQNDTGQVGPLQLGLVVRLQLRMLLFAPQSPANAGADTARTARALVRGRPGHGEGQALTDARLGVGRHAPPQAAVHDDFDPGYGQRGLGDGRREDDLAPTCRGRLQHLILLLHVQGAIERAHHHLPRKIDGFLVDQLVRPLDEVVGLLSIPVAHVVHGDPCVHNLALARQKN
mmetsp:Transcript_159352/g.511236  ORF Transcript_159352/g.511236 Transcript_159352/m.511236 type:complete len:235 (+) Transcript_159352:2457-3161(+)